MQNMYQFLRMWDGPTQIRSMSKAGRAQLKIVCGGTIVGK